MVVQNVAIVAAITSLISAAFSIYFNWLSRKTSTTSLRVATFNARQTERARLMRWAEEAMDSLSDLYIYYAVAEAPDAVKRKNILTCLTSSIDKGRWLLPNLEHDSFGKNKESAYTGLRQAALDDLVDAYDLLLENVSAPDSASASNALQIKRRFASVIQEKLEPRAVEFDLLEMRGTTAR